jgi:acetyltransferase-like isoleucine patch superfamily enzyme
MRWRVAGRIAGTAVAVIVTETLVCTVAAAPVVWVWLRIAPLSAASGSAVWIAVCGAAIVPSYVTFALLLTLCSPVATYLTGARTPTNVAMRIADCDSALMRWARYMAAIHIVRVLAGTWFRGTPVWTLYLRLNGARIGRRVYINTTSISDHNLLTFGDDVVVGADVHLSGHTVERGYVLTGPVHIGRGVTLGLGSVIDIDVTIGDATQVGALTFVPKHARLESHAVYFGIPAVKHQ